MTVDADLRCVTHTVALGEEAGGTAGSAHRYLLIELPLPWPKKIDHHPLLLDADGEPRGDMLHGPDGSLTRVLAVSDGTLSRTEGVRTDPAGEPQHRVTCYRRTPDAPFRSFTRHRGVIGDSDIIEVIDAVVADDLDRIQRCGLEFDDDPDHVDLLLCTHGSRDRCCGSLGTALHLELLDDHPDHVTLWRTSHTGGHRFAPTGMTFPDGMTWGRLDLATTLGILDRSIDTAELLPHHRGCVGLDTPTAQIADAVALARVGWRWLDQPRSVTAAFDDLDVTVSTTDDAARFVFEAVGSVPVPVCGEPIEAATKSTTVYRVIDEPAVG